MFNSRRDGGVCNIAGSVITGCFGKPYSALKADCCLFTISDENEGPICPKDAHNRYITAKDKPITIKQRPSEPILLNLFIIFGLSPSFDINIKKGKDIKKVPKVKRSTF